MAKSLDIRKYDMSYFDLLYALNGRQEYIIPFDDMREALSFRFDWYAFTKALGATPSEEKNYKIACKFSVVADYPIGLRFVSRDNSPASQAIRRSFEFNQVDPTTLGIDQSMSREEASLTLPPEFPIGGKDKTQEMLEQLGYVTSVPSDEPDAPRSDIGSVFRSEPENNG